MNYVRYGRNWIHNEYEFIICFRVHLRLFLGTCTLLVRTTHVAALRSIMIYVRARTSSSVFFCTSQKLHPVETKTDYGIIHASC